MQTDTLSLLANSVRIADRFIRQSTPSNRHVMVARYLSTYERYVSALIDQGFIAQALVFAERAKALTVLPETPNFGDSPDSEDAAFCLLKGILAVIPDTTTTILSYFVGEHDAFGWALRQPLNPARRLLGPPMVGGGRIAPTIGAIPIPQFFDIHVRQAFRGRFDNPERPTGSPAAFTVISGKTSLGEMVDWELRRRTNVDSPARLFHRKALSDQDASARILYEILVKKAEAFLDGVEQLVIVPDGPLFRLPFEALSEDEPDAVYDADWSNSNFLVKRVSVAYSESIFNLREVRARSYSAPILVAFGNPAFPANTVVGGARLSPIPLTETEVAEISSSFQRSFASGSSQLFLRHACTVQSFCKHARSADYLHVATHGVYSDSTSGGCGLLFCDGEGKLPRLLRTDEISVMDLHAEVVVLSACRSGLGEYERGHGLNTLARAFRRAGARSVVATLWNVGDSSTVDFMRAFYDALLSGASVSVACATAKRTMINTRPDPFYWASFVVFQDSA